MCDGPTDGQSDYYYRVPATSTMAKPLLLSQILVKWNQNRTCFKTSFIEAIYNDIPRATLKISGLINETPNCSNLRDMIPINMYTMQLLIINSKTTKLQSNMGYNTSISRKSHCVHEVGLRPYFQKPGHQLLTFFNYREYVVCATTERNSGADL